MNLREAGHEVQRAFMQSPHAQVLADVPAALFPYWAEHARLEFAGIPRDASFFAQSAEGLTMFFELAAAARKTCALPSRAADSCGMRGWRWTKRACTGSASGISARSSRT